MRVAKHVSAGQGDDEMKSPMKHIRWRFPQMVGMATACLVAGVLLVFACLTEVGGGDALVMSLVESAYADEASSSEGETSGQSASGSASDKDEAEEKEPEDDNLVDPTQRADNSFIYDTTIESLFEESSLYDNRVVQVIGEVIGDRIASDEAGYYWITLTSTNEDNPTTISVLLSGEQAGQIDHYGRYGVVGTTFQVRGVYHQACQMHQGLPDIHAANSATITRGVEHHDKLRLRRFVPGVILVFLGLVLMGAYFFVREKMR